MLDWTDEEVVSTDFVTCSSSRELAENGQGDQQKEGTRAANGARKEGKEALTDPTVFQL